MSSASTKSPKKKNTFDAKVIGKTNNYLNDKDISSIDKYVIFNSFPSERFLNVESKIETSPKVLRGNLLEIQNRRTYLTTGFVEKLRTLLGSGIIEDELIEDIIKGNKVAISVSQYALNQFNLDQREYIKKHRNNDSFVLYSGISPSEKKVVKKLVDLRPDYKLEIEKLSKTGTSDEDGIKLEFYKSIDKFVNDVKKFNLDIFPDGKSVESVISSLLDENVGYENSEQFYDRLEEMSVISSSSDRSYSKKIKELLTSAKTGKEPLVVEEEDLKSSEVLEKVTPEDVKVATKDVEELPKDPKDPTETVQTIPESIVTEEKVFIKSAVRTSSPKYHKFSILIFFGTLNWSTVLDKTLQTNVYVSKYSRESLNFCIESIIKNYGTKLLISSRATSSDEELSNLIQEFHELIQLETLFRKNLSLGSKAIIEIEQLKKLYTTAFTNQTGSQATASQTTAQPQASQTRTIVQVEPNIDESLINNYITSAYNDNGIPKINFKLTVPKSVVTSNNFSNNFGATL